MGNWGSSTVKKLVASASSDWYIITGSSKELLENEIKPLVEEFMRERGLELSQEKTRITHIEDGFDFLGQNVRKYKGKVIIKPAKKNVKTFLNKVRTVIKANKQATARHLIRQLNPIIRGWANYHQHVASKQTFTKVDHAIYLSLWQWAKRRYPKKSRRWIKEKYFHSIGDRNWVFCGKIVDKQGEPRPIQLFYAHRVPIKWHTKIKGAANPYDPAWELYFEQRLGVKMEHNLKSRRQLLYLWKEQGGICPICKQKITKLTGWHNHHIVWRVNGGGGSAVTPTCYPALLGPVTVTRLQRHFAHLSNPLIGGVRALVVDSHKWKDRIIRIDNQLCCLLFY